MFEWLSDISGNLIERGGPVMWPLLAMSLVALTLIFERAWFYIRTNTGARRRRMSRIAAHLRAGETDEATAMIRSDDSVYGDLVRQLTSERATDAVATDAVERVRPRLERFMPTLGTIITAAPMLGILGTVLGIIGAFDLLGAEQNALKLEEVSGKIAEALITTVAGLIVAIVVLFPYNSFRAQIERTLGMMETLIAAAQHDAQSQPDPTDAAPVPSEPLPPTSGAAKSFAIVVIGVLAAVGIVAICMTVIFYTFVFPGMKELANTSVEAVNLTGAYKSMYTHSVLNDDQFPVHVGQILDDEYLRAEEFDSPGIGTDGAPSYDGKTPPKSGYRFGDLFFVYEGLGGDDGETSAPGDAIVGFGLQRTDGKRNVLFGNGSVRSVDAAAFMKLVNDENARRAKTGNAEPIDPKSLGASEQDD